MRILIAHSFYRLPGGEDRYVEDQLALLSGAGHEVQLYRRENAELKEGGSTAARMTYSRQVLDEVLAELRSFRPDVVHLHNAYPSLGPAVHMAAKNRRVPLVMTVHNLRLRCPNGLMFTEGSISRRCERGVYLHSVLHECFPSRRQAIAYASSLWIHRFVLRLEDKVRRFITPSEFMRRRLIEWDISPERVSLVRHMTRIPSQMPAQLGDSGLYVGRLAPEKGVDVLLRALAAAGDPPFRIVGGGPAQGSLVQLAAQLGLRNVEFVGSVDPTEVDEFMRQSRFVVIPSRWEEIAGLAAAEAMAHGRPLVVSRSGGLPEFVENGEGLAFDVGDVPGLAKAIQTLMNATTVSAEMGRRARAFAEREFSSSSHITGLEAVYEQAVS